MLLVGSPVAGVLRPFGAGLADEGGATEADVDAGAFAAFGPTEGLEAALPADFFALSAADLAFRFSAPFFAPSFCFSDRSRLGALGKMTESSRPSQSSHRKGSFSQSRLRLPSFSSCLR